MQLLKRFGVHEVVELPVVVQILHLLFVHNCAVDAFGGREAVVRHGTVAQITHTDLHESAEVARRTVNHTEDGIQVVVLGALRGLQDVKIPMYILSRFNDLKDKSHKVFSENDNLSGCWIVTNNRFTSDATSFASCSGLKLLSWDHPFKNNLRTKIDNKNLYPITSLTTLTLAEKDKLMILDILLVKEIINNTEILEKIGLSTNRIKNVLKEASELCKYI